MADLEKLLEEAGRAPAPWKASKYGHDDERSFVLDANDQWVGEFTAYRGDDRIGAETTALVVALRNAAPKLLRVVEAARVVVPAATPPGYELVPGGPLDQLRRALADLDAEGT